MALPEESIKWLLMHRAQHLLYRLEKRKLNGTKPFLRVCTIPEKCRFDPGKEEARTTCAKTVGYKQHTWPELEVPGLLAFLGTVCRATVRAKGLKLDSPKQEAIQMNYLMRSAEIQVTPQAWRWS